MVIMFGMGFFYGLIDNNKIDSCVNQNVVILGKTCFGIYWMIWIREGTYVSSIVCRVLVCFLYFVSWVV